MQQDYFRCGCLMALTTTSVLGYHFTCLILSSRLLFPCWAIILVIHSFAANSQLCAVALESVSLMPGPDASFTCI